MCLAHVDYIIICLSVTGDSLHTSNNDLEILMSEGAVVKEMEAASVAWVCEQLQTPFLALKSITDLIDGSESTHQEFYLNLKLASERLQDVLERLVRYIWT